MFYRKVIVADGIPFRVNRIKPPMRNVEEMTSEELEATLEAGRREIEAGNYVEANEAFTKFLEDTKE